MAETRDHRAAPIGGGPFDRTEVNVNQGDELRFWAKEFNVSVEQVKSAVRRVGTAVEDVRRELKREGL